MKSLGIRVEIKNIRRLIELGLKIRDVVNGLGGTIHPENPYIKGVDLTMIYEKTKHETLHYREVTIFGDGEFDRSPCGTGTAAMMACLYADGTMDIGDLLLHESVIGAVFEGRILGSCKGRGLQGSDSGDLWDCLCDRDISGNSGAGGCVEVWVFNVGCLRGEVRFFADLWVVHGLKRGEQVAFGV